MDAEGRLPDRTSAVYATFLLLAVVYVVSDWGIVTNWFGDTGRWLHEVDRMARGQVPYRDFSWAFPPLALWTFGAVARLTGGGVTGVFACCSLLFLGTMFLAARYVTRLPHRGLPHGALLAGAVMLVGIPLASYESSPLPSGTYSPAQPLGFFFLLAAIVIGLPVVDAFDRKRALAASALFGAAILTKQDFWISSGLGILLLSCGALGAGDIRGAVATATAAVLVVAAGALAVGLTAGAEALRAVPGGGGHVEEFVGMGFPSWRRLVVEGVAMSAIGAWAALSVRVGGLARGRRIAMVIGGLGATMLLGAGLYVWCSVRAAGAAATGPDTLTTVALAPAVSLGNPLWKPALKLLHEDLLLHVVPAMLPVALFLLVFTNRGRAASEPGLRVVLVLLALAAAARARRLFEFTEWYHVVLELPVYAAVFGVFWGARARRAATVFLIGFLAVGAYVYHVRAVGPLTRVGTFEWLETVRGPIRVQSSGAAHYRWLQEELVDIPRDVPIFAFGYTGGFSYFLGRPNPTPATQGFVLSYSDSATVAAAIDSLDRVILLDARNLLSQKVVEPRIDFTRWSLRVRLNHYERIERPWFEARVRHCRQPVERRSGGFSTRVILCEHGLR